MWLSNFAALSQRAVERTGPPIAFVVPAGQRDPQTTTELLQVLQRGGVELTQAKARFVADGVTYPAGSAVIPMAQPYGAYAKTLLEAQKYPDLRLYPDGPPKPPYDITAHSLPLQMGVEAIAVSTPFKAECTPVSGLMAPAKGTVKGTGTAGIVIGAETNASVKLVNALLAEGLEVSRTSGPVRGGGEEYGPGTYVVPATGDTLERIRNRCVEYGVRAAAVERVPTPRGDCGSRKLASIARGGRTRSTRDGRASSSKSTVSSTIRCAMATCARVICGAAAPASSSRRCPRR